MSDNQGQPTAADAPPSADGAEGATGPIPGGRDFLFRRQAAASGLLLRGKRTGTVLRQADELDVTAEE